MLAAAESAAALTPATSVPLRHAAPLGAKSQLLIETLLATASVGIAVLQPCPPSSSREELDDPAAWSAMPEDAMDRGVSIRSVYDERLLEIDAVRSLIHQETRNGATYRVARAPLPTYMLLIDEATALVLPRSPDQTVIFTHEQGHVALFQLVFETYWAESVTVGLPAAEGGLDTHHLEILTLIRLGRPNKSIARTLRLHERTIRRRIDELHTHFGVTDRHDLIVAASNVRA